MSRDIRAEAEEAILDARKRRVEGELTKFLKDNSKVAKATEMFGQMNESLQTMAEGGGLFGDLKAEGKDLLSVILGPFTENLIPAIEPLVDKLSPLIEKIVDVILPAVEWFVDRVMDIFDLFEDVWDKYLTPDMTQSVETLNWLQSTEGMTAMGLDKASVFATIQEWFEPLGGFFS